jgi:ATP-binding cassette subfamily C (CFTR/MRP) protein 1
MLETSQGEIYLDDQAISDMSSFSLRNSLTIVPQNALILTATIRDNLDPSRQKQDSELWNALEVCKLLNVVKSFPDGLDTKLANDINLSSGQRQLFSLARALLRNRKVLVLDEATSSMDYETDAAVQQILRTQFNHCTIITVAHRIATVRDYDRILVLSNGQMVELDTPDALMKQKTSIFRALAIEQGVH